jgi:hypothetical protein
MTTAKCLRISLRRFRPILSSSDNLIPDSSGVKRQADKGGSTARVAPTAFCPFQKHCRKTRRVVQFLLLNGARWSVNNLWQKQIIKEHTKCNFNRIDLLRETTYSCSQQSVYFWKRYNVADRSRMSQAMAGPCWRPLCAALGSSDIKLSEYIYTMTDLFNNFRTQDTLICRLLYVFWQRMCSCLTNIYSAKRALNLVWTMQRPSIKYLFMFCTRGEHRWRL